LGEKVDRGCRKRDRAQGWLIGTQPQRLYEKWQRIATQANRLTINGRETLCPSGRPKERTCAIASRSGTLAAVTTTRSTLVEGIKGSVAFLTLGA